MIFFRRIRGALLRRHLAFFLGLCIIAVPSPGWSNPYLLRLKQREVELTRRRSTIGGMIPLLDVLSFWDRVSPAEVERVLRIAQSRGTHPLVRGYGQYLLSQAALHRGRIDEALAFQREAGFVTTWLFCGPFDNQGKQGHAQVYEVERELKAIKERPDLKKTYAGKEQGVQWRTLPSAPLDARVSLAELIEPNQEVTVYLQTFIFSPRKQAAALRLGTGGAYKIFLDGREIAEREVYRLARVDQEVHGLWLRRGFHRLVIKESVAGESLDLYVRMTRPDGGPLIGVVAQDHLPDGTALVPLPDEKQPGVAAEDLSAWLKKRLEKHPDDLVGLRDVALLQLYQAPDDASSGSREEAAKHWADRAARVEAFVALSLAAKESHTAREALEKAHALDPEDPWILLRLGEQHLAEGRDIAAVRLWQRALEGDPGFFPAQQKLAELYRSSGLEVTAAAMLERAIEKHPEASELSRQRAELASLQDDLPRSEGNYLRYLETHQDDVGTYKALADLAIRRNDTASSLAYLDTAIHFHPSHTFLRLDRARLLAGSGRPEEAAAECRRVLAINPRSARVWEKLGQYYYQAKSMPAAWNAWKQALILKPQNAELRGLLAFLDPQRGKGMAERRRVDPAAVMREARRIPPGQDPARVLLDLTATEVHRNGLSRTLHQRLIRVEDPEAAKGLSSYVIRYSPDRQVVQVKAAQLHRAGGAASEQAAQSEVPLNEPWARLWYDLRGLALQFPAMRPGDVLEIEYLIEDVAAENMFADYFGDMVFLQEELPVHRFEYVLITPPDRRFYIRQPKLSSVHYKVSNEGDLRIYSWIADGIPKVIGEPNDPGWSEVADYLHISTYQRWEDVARWYWGLIAGQIKRTRQVTETATKITAGADTEEEKIRAVYDFVVKTTRYIGLEFGIHGYKPYAADQVLARKFGDCKDKATLLVALLEAVGISASLVVVRTKSRGAVDAWPASLAPFNHVIVYVPKHRIYLDGTAEFSGSRELPDEDQGVMALHVDREAGRLRQTPLFSPKSNLVRIKNSIILSAEGQARVSEDMEISGAEAAQWRSQYQAVDHRRETYEKALNAIQEGVKVLRVEMPNLDNLEVPVRVSSDLIVQGLARRDVDGGLSLPFLGRESHLASAWARLSWRKHALSLAYPFRFEGAIRIEPPRGWQGQKIPADTSLATSFGSFSRRVKRAGAVIEIDVALELTRNRIAAEEYAAFRAFILQVDRLEGERVIFVR